MNLGVIKIDSLEMPVKWASLIKDLFWMKIPDKTFSNVALMFINGVDRIEYKGEDYSAYNVPVFIKDELNGEILVSLRKEPANDE